jgi:hypothetical protein
MKWVSIGSSISPPTIDEPCSTAESGNGVFCPHTLYLDNRAWNDPWSQIPAHNPGLQDSNGNYRYRYLAATQLFSGSVLKIMVVNQLGYIISANEIWED